MTISKAIKLIIFLFYEVALADVGSLYRISPDLDNRSQTPSSNILTFSDEAFTFSQSSTVQPYFVSASEGFENQFGWHGDNTEPTNHESGYMIWKNTSGLVDGDRPASRKTYKDAGVVIGDDLCYLRDDIAYLYLTDYKVYAAAALNSIDLMRVIAATLPELGLLALSFGGLSSGYKTASDDDNADLNNAEFAIDLSLIHI